MLHIQKWLKSSDTFQCVLRSWRKAPRGWVSQNWQLWFCSWDFVAFWAGQGLTISYWSPPTCWDAGSISTRAGRDLPGIFRVCQDCAHGLKHKCFVWRYVILYEFPDHSQLVWICCDGLMVSFLLAPFQLNCQFSSSIPLSVRNCVRDYVHRIGRTGRAGRQGFSCTLLDESAGDFKHCQHIVNVLEERHVSGVSRLLVKMVSG